MAAAGSVGTESSGALPRVGTLWGAPGRASGGGWWHVGATAGPAPVCPVGTRHIHAVRARGRAKWGW